jgi:predicted transcriptional regulator
MTTSTTGNLPTYTINPSATTAGTIYTSNGFNGASWTTTNTTGYQISPSIVVSNDPSSLDVKGKIIHNGRDLEERLQTIEKVLMIPERDVIMEKKYPKLKKMYEEYIKELSKYRMWEDIKGNNNGN